MKSQRLAVLVCLFVSSTSFAEVPSSNTPWESTLTAIEAKFEEIYCFKALKRLFFKWDARVEMNRTRQRLSKISDPTDTQAARDALIPFYNSTRDIHVGARFKTSSKYSISRLPFVIRSADHKKYYIVNIDRAALPVSQYPFEIGDELVSVDSKPVSSFVQEYLPTVFAQFQTQHALAERYAFTRYDVLGKPHKTGPAEFAILRKNTKKVEVYKTTWITTDKPPAPALRLQEAEELRKMRKGFWPVVNDEVDAEFMNNSITAEADLPIRNYGTVGAKKPFFPALGTIAWETQPTDPFYAYISVLPNGKKTGFIRVPTYYPKDIITVMVPAFYSIIDRFVDEHINVMVYDQTNNGGGSLLYTYDLLAALIDKPVRSPMRTQWILDDVHHEVDLKWADLRLLAEQALTDPIARDKFQNEVFSDKILDDDFIHGFISLADLMLTTLKEPNHPRLSAPFPFEGQEFIKPRVGKHYTGPIVMLNNELSISNADLTPALFQDMGRAVMFGTRTSGAGAYQNGFEAPSPNPFELWYSSISFGKFIRKNGLPVETLGVSPDVRYSVTGNDIQNGMQGYHSALMKLIQKY